MTRKEKPKPKNTQIRVTTASAAMLRKLAKTLYETHTKAHEEKGLKTPSSRLAIDYLIYEGSMAGVGSFPTLTEENNLYMMIMAGYEEE
jgi:hypothetical protein